ncbi:MAG: hypothetical protein ACOCQM_04115, partial [Natronomonas sp.]
MSTARSSPILPSTSISGRLRFWARSCIRSKASSEPIRRSASMQFSCMKSDSRLSIASRMRSGSFSASASRIAVSSGGKSLC